MMSGYNRVLIYDYMNRSEQQIHHLFNRFAEELYNRRQTLSEEILDWRNIQMRRIEGHAREQLRLLEQEYEKQRISLNSTRQQFINATQPHEQRRDNERIDQLLAQCKALKFELAALEFPEQSMLFIEFMTEEQSALKKRNEKSAERVADNRSRNNPVGDHGNYSANSTGAHGSSPSKSTSPTAKQNNAQTPTSNQNTNDYQRSNSSDGHLSRTDKNDDSFASKCPTCYMIFPSHMTSKDRNQHAEEHFKDS